MCHTLWVGVGWGRPRGSPRTRQEPGPSIGGINKVACGTVGRTQGASGSPVVDWVLTGVRALTEVPGAPLLMDLGRTTRWARVQDIVENAHLYLLLGSVQKSDRSWYRSVELGMLLR